MVSIRVIFEGRFYLYLSLFFLYFGGVFNKAIIRLAFIEHEMAIANSYLPRACGIIVKYGRHLTCCYLKVRVS